MLTVGQDADAQRPAGDRRRQREGDRHRRRDARRRRASPRSPRSSTQKQIRELPLNGRDFSQLTLLQPGVTASPSTPQQVDRGMGTQVSIAGARPNQISYQLDGTDANTQGNGSPGSAAGGLLGVDTVREFQVLVNNYSAEYGRSSRRHRHRGHPLGHQRRSTAPLFEFNRDSRWDSKTYFDPTRTADIPPLHRNQFGGHFGGPIAPRPDVLLRQLRRPAPGSRPDDDRDRAEPRDARPHRHQPGDAALPAPVPGAERQGDRRHRHLLRAERRADARELRARQGRPGPDATTRRCRSAIRGTRRRSTRMRPFRSGPSTRRPEASRSSASTSGSSRRRCSTSPRSRGTARSRPPTTWRTARSTRACSSCRARASATCPSSGINGLGRTPTRRPSSISRACSSSRT